MTDQEINEAVAKKLGWAKGSYAEVESVSGNSWTDYPKEDGTERMVISKLPDFCHDIKAAWEIVDFIESKQGAFNIIGFWHQPCSCGDYDRYRYEVRIYNAKEPPACARADSAPMAICKAFLKLEDQ